MTRELGWKDCSNHMGIWLFAIFSFYILLVWRNDFICVKVLSTCNSWNKDVLVWTETETCKNPVSVFWKIMCPWPCYPQKIVFQVLTFPETVKNLAQNMKITHVDGRMYATMKLFRFSWETCTIVSLRLVYKLNTSQSLSIVWKMGCSPMFPWLCNSPEIVFIVSVHFYTHWMNLLIWLVCLKKLLMS
jgi:hypothetical protein